MNEELPKSDLPKRPRRRRGLRFGLLSLLVLVTLTGIALSFIFGDAYRMAAAKTFLQNTNTYFGSAGLETALPAWKTKIYGEDKLKPVSSIRIAGKPSNPPNEGKYTKTNKDYWAKLARHSVAFPQVRNLTIKHVEIPSDAGLVLSQFKNLEQLTCTRCTFETIEVLDHLHNARIVYLDQCQVELNDVESLRAKFPNTFFVVSNAGPEYQSPVLRQ